MRGVSALAKDTITPNRADRSMDCLEIIARDD